MKRDIGTYGALDGQQKGRAGLGEKHWQADPTRRFIGKYDIIALEKGRDPCVYLN